MALLRNAQAQIAARQAVVLDLGDLKRQGDAMQATATRRAEAILENAHQRREELMATAAEDGKRAGYAEGYTEGLEQGFEEGRARAAKEHEDALAVLGGKWMEAIDQFEQQRDHLFVQARLDVLRLAIRLAEKVVKRSIEVDESIVVAQLEAVLALLSRQTRLVVAVHPDDEGIVHEFLPSLASRFQGATHVDLVTDDSLDRGSVVARTEAGAVLDASIDTQLERLALALLPAEHDTP